MWKNHIKCRTFYSPTRPNKSELSLYLGISEVRFFFSIAGVSERKKYLGFPLFIFNMISTEKNQLLLIFIIAITNQDLEVNNTVI